MYLLILLWISSSRCCKDLLCLTTPSLLIQRRERYQRRLSQVPPKTFHHLRYCERVFVIHPPIHSPPSPSHRLHTWARTWAENVDIRGRGLRNGYHIQTRCTRWDHLVSLVIVTRETGHWQEKSRGMISAVLCNYSLSTGCFVEPVMALSCGSNDNQLLYVL